MKKSNIRTLRQELPQVFTTKPRSLPDGLTAHESGFQPDLDRFERTLIEDLEPQNSSAIGAESTSSKRLPPEPVLDREQMSTAAKDMLAGSHTSNGDLSGPFRELAADGDFPGGPSPIARGGIPPVDALAFYLPFHRFSPDIYGIYLIADGVRWLSYSFFVSSRNFLTAHECLILAKAFLFHHEAYHNAVEVFATRMELAHRVPVYETGAVRWFKQPPSSQHEEALATGYALNKARLALPSHKRAFAGSLLRAFVRGSPPPYSFGSQLCTARELKLSQNVFQEEVLTLAVGSVSRISATAWNAGLLIMSPSLARGNRFSYVVSNNSPLAKRIPLGSVYFADRRKVIKNLKALLGGGNEVAGGRHPIFLAPDGTRTPIPHGKDVDEGTLGNILKQLGIEMRPRDFMNYRR